jgi:hypothetical protein
MNPATRRIPGDRAISMTWCRRIALIVAGFAFAAAAVAQQPLTPRSVVPALDALKQTYAVPGFHLGGRYDIDRPREWENGGAGGTTLESLGAQPAHTAYIAVGTPGSSAAGTSTSPSWVACRWTRTGTSPTG